ncbi:hypothetical protein [Thermococcus sp. 21S7]|uniref:hypothetical protein n=1 Tax=Thermococcus sp. 21S7 TaxID=1638221 RepID=UPI00143925CC|nr:hypothetical protein [Thermococcus sp. 21S7]NJE62459.1 hypothetical protein [Thermococcus sp. 21S7]
MERLKALIGRNEDKVDFVSYLITIILTNKEFYSDEILFRDAVEEIYRTLRSEVVDNGRKDLIGAYEKAVLLRAVVSGPIESTDKLLLEIKKALIRWE